MDPYKVLGLQPGATEEEVKSAYRALAQKYNPDMYEAGPLKDQAEQKMNELNDAFDTVMNELRVGKAEQGVPGGSSTGQSQGEFADVRNMIRQGQADQALAVLQAVDDPRHTAEWYFLMGSAYYYKGWMGEALQYFQIACRMDPSNREYAAALANLQRSAEGEMPGDPYGVYGGAQANAIGCNCCDMCMTLWCMNLCCSCGQGC